MNLRGHSTRLCAETTRRPHGLRRLSYSVWDRLYDMLPRRHRNAVPGASQKGFNISVPSSLAVSPTFRRDDPDDVRHRSEVV
jgi:hypothetical protein